MNFRRSHQKSDMDVLLEHGRVLPATPTSVRARALARARSTAQTATTELVDIAPMARHRGSVIALAAAVAFIVGAAGAAVALRTRTHNEQHVTQPPSPQHVGIAACTASCGTLAVSLPPQVSAQPSVEQPAVEPKATRADPAVAARESYTAELGLLQRAQAAFTDRSFATALLLVSEHARRFPNGRLVEEREALRVKALVGAGREGEARKASSAFSARFPRSALLPRRASGSASDK
jgi:hypothetical protein